MTEEILKALANDPAGIQVTMYPNRVTIDMGYGTHERFTGNDLETAIREAADWVIGLNQPKKVVEALEPYLNELI
jgi:hypothetical protein